MSSDHKRIERALGYSLTLGDFKAWTKFSLLASVRLTPVERAGLAWAALRALEPEQAESVALGVLHRAGPPHVPFEAPMTEARAWTDYASEEERKAYLMATWESLPHDSQMAFLRFLSSHC